MFLPMRRHRRPIIGVTGPDRGGAAAWIFTWLAVNLAGGRAVRITPRHRRRIAGLHGLIVGGGADINPRLYGQPLHLPEGYPPVKPRRLPMWKYLLHLAILPITWLIRAAVGKFSHLSGHDLPRDALELGMIDAAARHGLPILGICRGAQLLNVNFGGSLHQHLTGFYVEDQEVRTVLPRKTVLITPGTRLDRLWGAAPRRVNALHRQAIRRLGDGLRVAARDRNGIVQAIEHETCPLILGVQWHPEFLPQIARQRQLFHALVHEAGRIASGSAGDANASQRRSSLGDEEEEEFAPHDLTPDSASV